MASRPTFTKLTPMLRQARPGASPLNRSSPILQALQAQRQQHQQLPLQPTIAARFAHTIPKPKATLEAEDKSPAQMRLEASPHYQLDFTCVPCDTRSRHKVSKQGYHHGSVLITCPSCRNRHVISDHLGIFGNRKVTVEDLMREKGRLVKRGTLGEDGDIEFYPDEGVAGADADAPDAADAKKDGSA
ncbi:DNL zinc finger protein [Colletotrichum sublineola]|uniref:Putative DNL zinc finger n=1 Tax=Colletotrichum sublineola TaxID=1173701 RepID=A0A066X4A7_COLSU|nr:DNL zinc finger protein [Colletotrichum sublineola]KDN63767.1 putative DNL zinc finger [Colletotrichum sublineola]